MVWTTGVSSTCCKYRNEKCGGGGLRRLSCGETELRCAVKGAMSLIPGNPDSSRVIDKKGVVCCTVCLVRPVRPVRLVCPVCLVRLVRPVGQNFGPDLV